ncbi:MAG: TRAP transporter large permease subunit [Proteobacteria bacterium]|nr:TRAP transporter large permease subunit [Pseudomonadota bacterium]
MRMRPGAGRSGEIDPSSLADGTLLASAGRDMVVRLWDTSTLKEIAVLKGETGVIEFLAISPDGRLAASGGILGVIVPPSLIFIVYGMATSTSIGALFLGGILPGLLFASAMCVANYIVCSYTSWGAPEQVRFSLRQVGSALWGAKFGLGGLFL